MHLKALVEMVDANNVLVIVLELTLVSSTDKDSTEVANNRCDVVVLSGLLRKGVDDGCHKCVLHIFSPLSFFNVLKWSDKDYLHHSESE